MIKGANMNSIAEYIKEIDRVIEKGHFKDNWQSLSEFKMPQWYKKGRFGLFIHWGVYSVPATETEWYPRLMYIPLSKSYNHRIQTYGKDSDYSQIIPLFKPDKFNADEWVKLFKESGAKYIMPVGEHHDGVKMYGSKLNRWNMVELNGVDYMEELHKACDQHGLGFLISSHRAEHYWFMNSARKYCPNSEVNKGINSDLYGPAYVPESGNIHKTDKEIHATKEWLEDWLASSCEMIDKNRPLAVYFDWWIFKQEFKPYLKKFLAYYYNRAIEWGVEVGVFYKYGAVMDGCAIFDVERGQIDGVSQKLWQNDTAIAKNSWGYTDGNHFKTAEDIIKNMVEVVSKNGCYMLNVGPKANGEICEEEKNVLKEIGAWLKINGEAIYDSNPFEVTNFEGKKSKNGSFKENKKFTSKDFCFTSKCGAIYVFPMGKIKDKYCIKSLKLDKERGIRYDITKVEILGLDGELSYTHSEKDLTVNIPNVDKLKLPICIKVSVD